MIRRLAWPLAAAWLLLSCSDDPATPGTVTGIAVTPSVGTLIIGDSVQLTANAHSNGQPTGAVVTWSSTDTLVLAVSSTGMIVAKRSGDATLRASSGTVFTDVPVHVVLAAADIRTDEFTTCAVTTHGGLACWGQDAGQFDSDTTSITRVPTLSVRGVGFRRVGPGNVHGCGLPADLVGTMCWGDNAYGQLGRGTLGGSSTRGPVSSGLVFDSLWTRDSGTCGLTATHGLHCWGASPVPGNAALPEQVTGSFVTAGLGYLHHCAVTVAGAAQCWGQNFNGQLGDSSQNGSSSPVTVRGGLTFLALTAGESHTCGIDAANDAWCWGNNVNGQLGNVTSGPRELTPVPVTTGARFRVIAAGYSFTCGLSLTGAAWCWGRAGTLGDGTAQATDARTPVQVAGGHTFTQLTAGGLHACALATDGKVWCWGYQTMGQLGQPGQMTPYLAPVEVAGQ